MKMLTLSEIASIKVFHLEVTEDEVDVYESCIRYLLESVNAEEIETVCGATKDELLAIREDLVGLLAAYTDTRPRSD